ncbi:GNAT family N-acetyltransferase [Aquimarina sp. 2201CG5-10]|uniref:GNAT family N-acetyltransferase n=1 Tax=Aquimarina callyspongiae TaxID=3098150 RepID=UPI002AB34EE9|nr:GNAT family N-acetyltransferase [Aquimarina sp. 2201CG5-10]MDY8134834.1 GNAT family N-acetyltransferase [Aquimarina sp. 2201CG5-10]
MKIRLLEEKDLEKASRLFDGYRVFYRKESDVEGAREFLSERLSQKDSKIYVCENEEDELAGFVQLYPLFSSTRMKKLWLLNDLFVDQKYRGKGISVQLIEKAKELVKQTNACGMFLETEISNDIGNNLYPRTGFELNEGSNFYEWSVK